MSETKRTPDEVLRDISPQLSDGLRQYVEWSVAARPKMKEAIAVANAAESWRLSQREPTLRSDEWHGVLTKLREAEAVLDGKAE